MERASFSFEDVNTEKIPILQWIAMPPYTYEEQLTLDSVLDATFLFFF